MTEVVGTGRGADVGKKMIHLDSYLLLMNLLGDIQRKMAADSQQCRSILQGGYLHWTEFRFIGFVRMG